MKFQEYVQAFSEVLKSSEASQESHALSLTDAYYKAVNTLLETKGKNKVYILGNGGSASIASHILTDFINVGKLNAQVLHDPALLTCMANDYGYENVYARVLDTIMEKGDVLVAISSSGKSRNICQAAEVAKSKGATIFTFSGFSFDNPLRQLGHINFWLNSCNYGIVEIGHSLMLHHISDLLNAQKSNTL